MGEAEEDKMWCFYTRPVSSITIMSRPAGWRRGNESEEGKQLITFPSFWVNISAIISLSAAISLICKQQQQPGVLMNPLHTLQLIARLLAEKEEPILIRTSREIKKFNFHE